MKHLMAVVLVLSLCFFALFVTSPLVFGGAAGQTVNGDTNGDGDRDISDATYYLRWLFQGGPEPVEIVCPVDQSVRVAELEAQLAAVTRDLYDVNEENTAQAEQMTVLQQDLVDAGAQVTALQGQLDDANAQVAIQAEQIAALEVLWPNLVVDCPQELVRSVSREPLGEEWDDWQIEQVDLECQDMADRLGDNLWRLVAVGRSFAGDPVIRAGMLTRQLSLFFRGGEGGRCDFDTTAERWFSYCDLECPE